MTFKCLLSLVFIPSIPLTFRGPLFAVTFLTAWAWAVRHSCSWVKLNRKLVINTSWCSVGYIHPPSLVVAPLHSHPFAFILMETNWKKNIGCYYFKLLCYILFICLLISVYISQQCASVPRGKKRELGPWSLRYSQLWAAPCDCYELNSGPLVEQFLRVATEPSL
jgi:ABC-type enterochelin transport system permease subunit